MQILAIDTSTRAGSLAFLRDRQVIGVVSNHDEAPYSTRLFRDIAQLQSEVSFQMDQIDVFAVGAGPGSFTGLRVGLTAVKAWAELYGKPVAAISGLAAIAIQGSANAGHSPGGVEMVAPYLDARRGQVFGAIYRCVAGESSTVELAGDEALLTAEEFLFLVKKNAGPTPPMLASPTPDVLPRAIVDSILPGVRMEEVSEILAPLIGQLAFDRARENKLVDALGLDANYIRRSDAEVFWTEG